METVATANDKYLPEFGVDDGKRDDIPILVSWRFFVLQSYDVHRCVLATISRYRPDPSTGGFLSL